MNDLLIHKTLSHFLNTRENSIIIDKHFDPNWKLSLKLYVDKINQLELDNKLKQLNDKSREEFSEKLHDSDIKIQEDQKQFQTQIQEDQKQLQTQIQKDQEQLQTQIQEQMQEQIQTIQANIEDAQIKANGKEAELKEQMLRHHKEIREQLMQQQQELKKQLMQQQQNMSNFNMSNGFPQQMYYPPMPQHTIYGHLMPNAQPYISQPIGIPTGVPGINPQQPSMSVTTLQPTLSMLKTPVLQVMTP